MKEFIEKLIERFEEARWKTIFDAQCIFENSMVDKCVEITKQFAEEYKGGWIPCTEKLPKDDSICIVTVEYPNNETVVDYGWFDRIGICWYVGIQEFRTSNILAWQPLPAPYQPKGE